MSEERVQKILAKAGIASRRKAEELITEGQVTINGKVAKLGDKAEFGKDAIKVGGKLIHSVEPLVYLAFHKPRGVISMMVDTEGRPTLASYLSKVKARIFPIGRLDFNSEGLILLTNDGDFAEEMQKRDNIPRVYEAKVKGHPDQAMIARLEQGARLNGKLVKPHSVRVVQDLSNKSRVQLVFLESGVVDVKALLEMKGFLVDKLSRSAIGHLTLHGLEPGHFRFLKESQIKALLDQPELGLQRLEHEAERAEEKESISDREDRLDKEKARAEYLEAKAEGHAPGLPVPRAEGEEAPEAERPARAPRTRGPRAEGERPRFGAKRFGAKREGFGEKRGGFGAKREGFGEKRGGFGAKREGFGEKRGGFGAKREGFGEKRGGFGAKREGFGEKRGGFGAKREGFGEKRGGFGAKREGFGDKRGGFGAKRPSFGRDRYGEDREGYAPKREGFGGKRGGGGFGKARFGAKRDGEGPRSEGKGFGRPSFGGASEGKRGFAGKGKFGEKKAGFGRSAFGDKPRTGRPGAGKPSFGDRKPTRGFGRGPSGGGPKPRLPRGRK